MTANSVLARDDSSLIARIRAGLSTTSDADHVEAALIRLRTCEEALAPIAAQCHCGHAFGAMSAMLPAMRLPDRKQDNKERKDV
jgi:hypothetical protein